MPRTAISKKIGSADEEEPVLRMTLGAKTKLLGILCAILVLTWTLVQTAIASAEQMETNVSKGKDCMQMYENNGCSAMNIELKPICMKALECWDANYTLLSEHQEVAAIAFY